MTSNTNPPRLLKLADPVPSPITLYARGVLNVYDSDEIVTTQTYTSEEGDLVAALAFVNAAFTTVDFLPRMRGVGMCTLT